MLSDSIFFYVFAGMKGHRTPNWVVGELGMHHACPILRIALEFPCFRQLDT
jgi:hypothetical protein